MKKKYSRIKKIYEGVRPRQTRIVEKIKESFLSTVPIIAIVILLSLVVSPIPTGLMLSFLVGSALVIVGMGLFSLGADAAMTEIGSRIGTALTKSKKVFVILAVSFVLGISITVSEPDLQVLAETVPSIDNTVLLVTVGIGVGLFLTVAMARMVWGIRLKWLLLGFYTLVFVLAFFADKDFLSVAFDSGGVTTGPMTVPFILSLGIGVAKIRADKQAESDSFGLVALCSIGPILSVLILSFFYPGQGEYVFSESVNPLTTTEMGWSYWAQFPKYLAEMAISLSPIVVVFLGFRLFAFRMSKNSFLGIIVGILYTYVGLVLFLVGVNIGFSPIGTFLGQNLAEGWTRYWVIPISMILGWFIISAEPAVAVLEKQIEENSAGAIPGKVIKISLSIGISVAMGLSAVRSLTGISVLWILVPGYVASLVLMFFVPDIFTAIAFDSGGVASGPMTATFMLQFFIGITQSVGGNVMTDAFGVVAIVAMMPLISIQITGLLYKSKIKKMTAPVTFGDSEIIELWG